MDKFLTPKQKQVLDFISAYTEKNEYAPSQQEIAKAFGFKSLGTVQHYLVQLGEQGYLQKSWNARRGTRVTPSGARLQDRAGRYRPSKSTSFELPLLGRVAAGLPIEAIESRETVEVPSFMLKEVGNHFVLQVKGDSMMDEGILEGDYVIFKKQLTANNGQTVVALINNEATIKKFYRRKDKIELHPANSSYRPIIVDSSQDFKIEGILAGVIRKIS